MTARRINQMLADGYAFERLEPDATYHAGRNPVYRRLDLNNNDAMQWRLSIIRAASSPHITIRVYRIHANNKVYSADTYDAWQWISRFAVSLSAGSYIFSISAKDDVDFRWELNRQHFIQAYEIKGILSDGEYGIVEKLDVPKHRPPAECHEPLRYELIDGELPKALKLAKNDGMIYGIIDDQDCGPSDDSPSFNWFYDNHDGLPQAWAKIYRFKLRVMLRRDPSVYHDDWFCIRVYNNWTHDRIEYEKSIEAIEREVELVQTDDPYTVSLAPQAIQEVRRQAQAKCEVCQDPTMTYDEEIIELDARLDFHFPFELRDYFIRNQMEPSRMMARLHNARLFRAAMFEEHPGNIRYELDLKPERIIIRKYELEVRNFDDFDAKLIASRNTQNQKRENTLNGYDGDAAVVSEWYW